MTLSNLQGEVLRQLASGALVPVSSGSAIAAGSLLMVRKGASFYIGSRFFEAQSQGDRWVQVAGAGKHSVTSISPNGAMIVRPVTVNGPGQ